MDWIMRERTDMYVYGEKGCPDYRAWPEMFTIKMYHGGQFDNVLKKYVGGKIDFFDCCDSDKMSMLEISNMLMGCVDEKGVGFEMCYKCPKDPIETALKLDSDADVIDMIKLVPETDIIEIFVAAIKPIAVENMPIRMTPTKPNPKQVLVIDVEEEDCDSEEEQRRQDYEREVVDTILADEGIDKTFSDFDREKKEKCRQARKRRSKKMARKRRSSAQATENTPVEASSAEFDDIEEGSWHDDDSNKDVSDNDDGFPDVVVPPNMNDYEKVGGKDVNEDGEEEEPVNREEEIRPEGGNGDGDDRRGGESDVDSFPDSVYENSDDERMAVSSEDEADSSYPEFDEKVDMASPKFELGMLFSSGAVLRQAIRTHAINERRPVLRTKNMGKKIQFHCKAPCQWRIYANKCLRSDSYQIRIYNRKHTCHPTFHQKLLRAKWIAWKYETDLRMNPKWDVQAFQRKVINDLGCDVSLTMIYRAKDHALDVIKGNHAKQYSRLWDYLNEVRKRMPDSTLKLDCLEKEVGEESGRFKRVYICLGPVRDGFLEGCRPIIGLDGTHLKGPFGGILLTAVGVDPNDGMFPLAWAVVDAENNENWAWFIQLLKDDIRIENSGAYTFISDKQKGLINAVEELCPDSEHRFCVMHLYRNMWKDHKGIGLRMLLWSAARSTTDYHFNKNMEELKKMNKKCYDWLSEKPKSQWSRAGFRHICKSDMFVNNHCEVFNNAIKKYRHLPIITMLKEIQKGVMCRIQKRREKMMMAEGQFCSNTLKKLNKAWMKAPGCRPLFSVGQTYSVTTTSGGHELVVNLQRKTCACNKWQLTGIPCFHAISCYDHRNIDPAEGIDNYYTIAKYLTTYSHFVEPINGEEFWEKTAYPPPLPPNIKPTPGRPKKKRSTVNDVRPEADAIRLKRAKTKNACGYCKALSHNIRSCPAKKNDKKKQDEAVVTGGGTTQPEIVDGAPPQPPATQPDPTEPSSSSNPTAPNTANPKKRGRAPTKRDATPLTKEKRKELLTPTQ